MVEMSDQEQILMQLLQLDAVDQQILETERGLRECREELSELSDGVLSLEDGLEQLLSRLQDLRLEARHGERAVEDKHVALIRVQGRVSNVQNERQYSAATLEADLLKSDLRTLENQVLDKLQLVEDTDGRRKEMESTLEEALEQAGPRRKEMAAQQKELEDALAIQNDRRENLALRMEKRALGLYDRIRAGKSEVALAPITDEGVCGYCHTFVTMQQRMEVEQLDRLISCEGCGVILYPSNLAV